jgi:hypothetical protein
MDDLYDTKFQSNGKLCKICIRYNSNDHLVVHHSISLTVYVYIVN